jgi:hypothetical protein
MANNQAAGSYATAFFNKLVRNGSGLAAIDFAALSVPMLEIALGVHGEGLEAAARWARLEKELRLHNLTPLLGEIASADPECDLAALRTAGSGWNSFDLVDVMDEELPPISWLVKPLIFRPSVTAWFGKPKTMKSLLALDMCLHIAGGLPWLTVAPGNTGGQDVTQARIVWIDLENGSATFKRRMKAFALAMGLGQARGQVLAYSMPDPWLDLSDHEHVGALISRIQALGDIGVLVIDHLGLALGPIDENSPLIAQVMGHIRQVAETCGVAIILIHHAKKGQGKDSGAPEDQLRGHGAILANVDAAYLIERDKTDRTQLKLTPVAVRGPDAPTLAAKFSFDQDPNLELIKARFWRMTWQSTAIKARQLIFEVLANGEQNQTELRALVRQKDDSLSDKSVRDAIAALEGTKEIVWKKADKGAKIYRMAEGVEEDEE